LIPEFHCSSAEIVLLLRGGVFYSLLLWLLSSETKEGRRYGNPGSRYRKSHRRHSRSLWFPADVFGLFSIEAFCSVSANFALLES
jgi:hypothetical protein